MCHAPRRSDRSSQASEVLILGLSRPVGGRSGRSRSTRPTGLSLLTDFPSPGGSRTSANAAARTSRRSLALRRASLVRTSASRAGGVAAGGQGSVANDPDSSMTSFVLSAKFNPLGWCLKMSRPCSIPTIARTLRRSSGPLPTAGIWDSGECLMLAISESPRLAVAFSWWRVLDAIPPWTSWLTPHQWKDYLLRVLRARSMRHRAGGLAILLRRGTRRAGSVSAARFSSLRRTDGVRWLSGSESLKYMGFPGDWMRAIWPRRSRRGMRSFPRSPAGSLRNFSRVMRVRTEGPSRIVHKMLKVGRTDHQVESVSHPVNGQLRRA